MKSRLCEINLAVKVLLLLLAVVFPIQSGLVGQWKLDEPTTDTYTENSADAGGEPHFHTDSAPRYAGDPAVQVGNGYLFEGNQLACSDDHPLLNVGRFEWSIAVWLYIQDVTNEQTFGCKYKVRSSIYYVL